MEFVDQLVILITILLSFSASLFGVGLFFIALSVTTLSDHFIQDLCKRINKKTSKPLKSLDFCKRVNTLKRVQVPYAPPLKKPEIIRFQAFVMCSGDHRGDQFSINSFFECFVYECSCSLKVSVNTVTIGAECVHRNGVPHDGFDHRFWHIVLDH